MKWVSERNTHIPLSMLDFLIDTPSYIPDDDFGEGDFDDEDAWD